MRDFNNYIQDHPIFYPGGTGQYAGAANGGSTIEFEAKVIQDLFKMGTGTYNSGIIPGLLDAYGEQIGSNDC